MADRGRWYASSAVGRVQGVRNFEIAMRLAAAPAWAFAVCLLCERFVLRKFVGVSAVIFGMAALALWAVQIWRHRYRFSQAAIETDRLANAEGLLLTRLELPVGEWGFELNNKLKALRVPWPDVRLPVLQLLLLALIVSVGLWWPLKAQTNPIANRAAAHTLDEIAEDMQVLKEAEGANAKFEAELEKLKELAREGDFAAPEWQAADALASAVSTEAEKASARLDDAANAARALEDAMKSNADDEDTQRAEEALERALMALSEGDSKSGGEQQAGGEQKAGESGEPKTGGESGAQSSTSQKPGEQGGTKNGGESAAGKSAEQIQSMREALEKKKAALEKKLAENSGGEGSGKPGEGQGSKSGKSGGASASSGKAGAGEGTSKQGGQGESNQHGKGGAPSRGGGHVPVEFGAEAELHPERLAVAPMPKGNGGDPDVYYGLKSAAPPPGPGNGNNISVGGAVGPAAAGFRPTGVLPRNEGVVKRYFQSNTKGAP